MQGLVASMIVEFGNEDQKKQLLPNIINGGNPAFALTEPDAGSDAQGIQTRAELRDGEWVINGNKIFITNTGLDTCDWVVVMCITGEREDGTKDFSAIIVPTDTPGYSISEECIHKMGWNNVDNRELIFQDCRVPEENLLGKKGRGVAQALSTLDLGRIDFGALSIGMAQGAFDLAVEYTKERMKFGKPISKFQAVNFKLADMKAQIEVGRLWYYRTAWLRDNGMPHTLEAAITKLFTSEVAHKVINEVLRMHGASGLILDSPISRFYRNIKIYPIGEGTNEIQRIVIARELGC